jgi:hypothetical protein
MPRHRRWAAAKQGVANVAVVDDRGIARPALAEVDIDAVSGNRQRPKEAGWGERSWVQVVDL